VCLNLLKGVELKQDVAHIRVEHERIVVSPLVEKNAVQVEPGSVVWGQGLESWVWGQGTDRGLGFGIPSVKRAGWEVEGLEESGTCAPQQDHAIE
jgi:hypothetical protein